MPRFCLRCLTIGLTFFGEGFQDGISLSGVVSCISVSISMHCSFIQSFFALLILFLMFLFSSRYCLCASLLVVLVSFSSCLWSQSFNTSLHTHGWRLIFGLPRTFLAVSRIAVLTELTRLLIFGSKKLSAANCPPIVALKCVAMFGSCSFSVSNLIRGF